MAKYQQYEEYKNSGVEWLGEIPKGWVSTQVKYGYTVVLGKMLQTTPKSNSDLLKPYLKAQNVQPSGIDLTNVGLMWFSADERKRLLLKKKDVLVSEGGDVGRSAIWDSEIDECYIQNAVNRVRPRSTNDSKFFYYWISYLKSTDFINIICNKATIAHYTAEKLSSSPILLPSALEQTKIANFLDHETAQIDTLIDKQQTLIQLLKEKRQAVISHAVTKGLNPDALMKDSGVEWLGDVPEHWRVIKLSNYAIPVNGDRGANYPSGNDFVDEGVFFISTSEVVDGYIKTDTASKITLKKYNQLGGLKIKKGDIIYCLRGSVGKSGICTFNEGTISSSLMGIRSVSIEPYYLKLLLASSSELQQRSMLVTGSVSANLSAQNVMGYRFAIPEKVEQLMIIAHVENSLEKIDILLSKATQAIQLMQERRIALISAAVTGKIDVRGWRASE